MPAPSSDRTPSARSFEPIPLHDPTADIGRAERRPTWWLDDNEHARLLGVKPGSAKTHKPKFTVKRRIESPPPPPVQAEAAPVAEFAALVPTLTALDSILQPLAADMPGLAPRLLDRGIKRIGRFGAAFGLAMLVAVAVFFR